MSSWKKIATMFALSASTVLLGAACTAEVEDTTEPVDPAAPMEVTEEAESELSIDQPDFDRDHFGRGCYRRCLREYRECRDRFDHFDRDRHDGRERFCRRRYERCLDRCRFRR
jgi:hypothetical protein